MFNKTVWKIYFENGSDFKAEDYFAVFSSWVPASEEIFIDAADYKHVVDGPLVVLIGHYFDYYYDGEDNRMGLVFNLKKNQQEPTLANTLAQAVKGVTRLSAEKSFAGKLKVNTKEIQFCINDRAQAPNNEATFKRYEKALSEFFAKKIPGNKATLTWRNEPKRRFAVNIQFEKNVSLEDLQ